MAIGDFGALLGDMEVLFNTGTAASLTDVQLLERFLSGGEAAGEVAFTALVKRHGPMVLRVCRGELQDRHAAEDAFQATFLILARQARTIRDGASLASWLYGVARRVARRAKLDRARRAVRERRSAFMNQDEGRHTAEPLELLPEIQEEVDRLPERYRSPIVLCYLEGRTHEEAASQLRIPVGTVKIRLSRGRERLRGRLIRRGLAPAVIASSLSAPARAALPAPLVDITVKAAMRVAAFRAAGVSATVAALVQGVLRAMIINRIKTAAVLSAASTMLIVASLVVVPALSTPARSAQEPGRRSIAPAAPKLDVTDPQAAQPVEVAVAVVKKAAFQRTTAQPGTVEPWQRVEVMPSVSGTVSWVAVDIGAAVKRGDVLAEIESPELELDLAKARATVQQANSRIMTARSRAQVAQAAVKTALATVASSEATLKAAETQVAYRKKQLDRLRQLVERGAVEHRLLDEEEDRHHTAEAEAYSAKVQVTVAKAGVEEAKAKLESATADTGEYEVGLRLAKIDQRKAEMIQAAARIVAPIEGMVTRRSCNAGEFFRAAASGGTNPLFTLMQTRSVRIVTAIPDGDVPFVDVGDPATFKADAFRGREYKGKVSRMADAEDTNDRTMRVEIDLDNADGRLRAGMYGRVEVLLDTEPALAIPSTAHGLRDRYPCCFRVVDGRAVLTRIGLLKDDGNRAVVSEGLKEGDIVAERFGSLRDGQEIRPVPSGRDSAPPTKVPRTR
jgi:RND family efflux transporter MFP subunit